LSVSELPRWQKKRANQFDWRQRRQALRLLEALAWGDMETAIYGLETALALAYEATGDAINLWEEEGEERFDDEFRLTPADVADLSDEWRLAYIARLLVTALHAYGVSPGASPGRPPECSAGPPLDWEEDDTSPARLLRGLNDILYGVGPEVRE